ncbi:hypothetical protein ACFO3O_03105 [Dokdonia ponticola]|uniref:Uncharacterized protein n=1 Tax=Dokdonia ponticola TaxID=2041041 RepID=A0ABV9HSW2_9FLAO
MFKVKRVYGIFLITGLILLIPLIAMQFTDEVQWSLMDFIVVGALLISAGLAINYIHKTLKNSTSRTLITIGVIILFLLIWAELAVGIFGTPLAGS